MVERVDRETVASFLARVELRPGAHVALGDDVAHHMRVRRLRVGDAVVLRDGAGSVAHGMIRQLGKSSAAVDIGDVERRRRGPAVDMLVPVADRDRTLWLAEKCTELGAASWRPVIWSRSRGVATKGEGSAFDAKVRARMASALAQSEGAWLPEVHPAAALETVLAALATSGRVLLDPGGVALGTLSLAPPVTIALGPEGGLERAERDRLTEAGFRLARLPGNILRFETAGVVALALALDSLANAPGLNDG